MKYVIQYKLPYEHQVQVGGAAEARTYTFRKPAAEALRAPGAGPAAQTPP